MKDAVETMVAFFPKKRRLPTVSLLLQGFKAFICRHLIIRRKGRTHAREKNGFPSANLHTISFSEAFPMGLKPKMTPVGSGFKMNKMFPVQKQQQYIWIGPIYSRQQKCPGRGMMGTEQKHINNKQVIFCKTETGTLDLVMGLDRGVTWLVDREFGLALVLNVGDVATVTMRVCVVVDNLKCR